TLRLVFGAGWDVELYSLSPDGRTIALSLNVEGYSELKLLDVQTRQARSIELPRGVIARSFVGNLGDRLVWSPDGRLLAFSLTTPRTTQDVWLLYLKSGEASQLTYAPHGGIPPESLVEPSLVHYPTFDGRS